MESAPGPLRARPEATLAMLLSMIFVDALGYGLIVPLLPSLVDTASHRALAVGGVASVYAGMQLVGMPMLGRLSDRVGRRPVLVLSIVGTASAYFVIALTRSVWAIYLAVALDGLTAGSLTAAQSAIADLWSGHRRTRYLGWLSAAFAAGIVAGPLFGGLFGQIDARLAPLIAGYLAAGNALAVSLLLRETRHGAELKVASGGRAEERSDAGPDATERRRAAAAPAIDSPIRSGILRFSLIAFCINFAFMVLPANLPVFAADVLGWGPGAIGGLLAVGAASAALTQIVLLGGLARRVAANALLAVSLAVMSVSLAAVPWVISSVALYFVIAAFSVGTSMAIPLVGSAVAEAAGRAATGTAIGLMNTAIGVSMLIAPLVAGAVYEAVGAWAPYAFGAGVVAIATLALRRSGRPAGGGTDYR